MAPWSQGAGSYPARKGEAGSLHGIEAAVKRGKPKLLPIRVDFMLSRFYFPSPEFPTIGVGMIGLREKLRSERDSKESPPWLELQRTKAMESSAIQMRMPRGLLWAGFTLALQNSCSPDFLKISAISP
jgi:hypothetical protein